MTGMMRVDAWHLATSPVDMRCGMDSLLARVIAVFGQAQPHIAYAFANSRASRIKVLLHDGHGLWLCCPSDCTGAALRGPMGMTRKSNSAPSNGPPCAWDCPGVACTPASVWCDQRLVILPVCQRHKKWPINGPKKAP